MKKPKLPRTDSIQKLAKFWDTHDLTDFEDQLEEVTEPVFERGRSIEVRLEPAESKVVKQIARSNGVSEGELIRGWVQQRLEQRERSGTQKKARSRRRPG